MNHSELLEVSEHLHSLAADTVVEKFADMVVVDMAVVDMAVVDKAVAGKVVVGMVVDKLVAVLAVK